MAKKKSAAKKRTAKKTVRHRKNTLPTYVKKKQTASPGYSELHDKLLPALPPGKRRSASGKTYYEYRKNRTDMPGKLTGIGSLKVDVKRMYQIASKSGSPLTKRVAKSLGSYAISSQYPSLETRINEVLEYGCVSGTVGELIYYHDTLKWYKQYKKEIVAMLKTTMQELGASNPSEVFGKNWDADDPFAEDTSNQNLLAWFSYEETARHIAWQLNYDV